MRPSTRATVWFVLVLAALADAFLAPFYPQFFERTFASTSAMTTGLYVAICRLAIALALPVWTRLTRTLPPLRVVGRAQLIAGACGLGCALAPNLETFLALSFFAEAARGAYLLLFPALAELAPEDRRTRAVVMTGVTLHATALLAAVCGGYLLEHASGRVALAAAAGLDFLQFVCLRPFERAIPVAAASAPAPGAGSRLPSAIWMLMAVAFFATASFVLIRPHFTLFVQAQVAPDASLSTLGALFVLPSAVAMVCAPFASRLATLERARPWLWISMAAFIGGTWLQLGATSLLWLCAARTLYGLGVYLADVIVDYSCLCCQRDSYGAFGAVSVAQNVALVLAPLAAGTLVTEHGWYVVFAAATATAAVAWLFSTQVRFAAERTAETPAPALECA